MNRKFATVDPTIWTGETGREWRRLGRDYQVLGHYLVTNPHAHSYGLYYLPLVIVAEETGIQRAPVLKVLETFAAQDYARYDVGGEWVWVLNMAARQMHLTSQPSPRDPRIAGLRRWYAECVPNPFLGPFYDLYHELFSIEARRDGGRWRPPTTADALVVVNGARGTAIELFEQFWTHYPKPAGKRAALGEWLKISPLPDAAFTTMCIEAVERQKRSAGWIKEGGAFIPDPERWLKKGRWDDSSPELPLLSGDDTERIQTYGDWAGTHEPPER